MSEDAGSEWVEVTAFGHTFQDFRGNTADLVTLEREGAIYSHFWDEESQAFRYYRIRFLPKEIFQYVEAHLTRQQFLNAEASGADFKEALNAISDPEIRERVRSYGDCGHTVLQDGTEADLRGCLASFLPAGMEELVRGQRPDRYELLPEIADDNKIALILGTIDNFPVVRRFLSDRKHGRPNFPMQNEYDTQDLLFSVLRSVFHDASPEEWTPPHGSSSKRIDIVIPSIETVIEVKHVRDKRHAKTVANELKVDIESYHVHPKCKALVAFVHDPEQHIVDPGPIMRDLSGRRVKGDSEFDVHVLVR